MARNCEPNALSIEASCFSGLSEHQLLAVIVMALCAAISPVVGQGAFSNGFSNGFYV